MISTTVSSPIESSFRVQQVAGMFDVPYQERLSETFAIDVPELGNEWRIGLIVGPSGSGKTTIARHWFGDDYFQTPNWSRTQAVVDGFGELSIRTITQLLTSVGFSSPPSWLKPYHVLSNGERFRCDLARALAHNITAAQTTQRPLVVMDEFTSVVDRTVAQIGSAAVAKSLKNGLIPGQFVAVTCHHDVAEWLQPDWIIDMQSRQFQWVRLRRPDIQLELVRCHYRVWEMFKRHHYLSGQLSRSARCYLAHWNGTPVAFVAVLPLIGQLNHWRITRLVTLPDFQGIGIGMRVAAGIAQLYHEQGIRMNITGSHPAIIRHCQHSAHWRTVRINKTGSRPATDYKNNYRGSLGRAIVSFEYVGSRDENRETGDEVKSEGNKEEERGGLFSRIT